MTKQKKHLYETVQVFTSFFNAEELYQKCSSKNLNIGIATVYRFLQSMERQGEIHTYLCNNRKIYSLSKKSHIHFTCEQCGKMEHLNITKIDFVHDVIQGKVCHFQVDAMGICQQCIQQEKVK